MVHLQKLFHLEAFIEQNKCVLFMVSRTVKSINNSYFPKRLVLAKEYDHLWR